MLAAAARAGNLLGESADGVGTFVRSRLAADGGFRGRSDAADLYYTVFGIESLLADAISRIRRLEKSGSSIPE